MTDLRRLELGQRRVRIPFDSLTLTAVTSECQSLVGRSLSRINQTDPLTVLLGFYDGVEQSLLVSVQPSYARAYLVARQLNTLKPVPTFGTELRKHLTDAKLVFVRQRGLDRVLELGFKTESSVFVLVAELMGKHSNMALVDAKGDVVAAAKWVGPSKSTRPILPGKPYEPPPFEPRPNLLSANSVEEAGSKEGYSPFLGKLLASGTTLDEVKAAMGSGVFNPVYSDGHGAYPLSVAGLGLAEVPRNSLSQALEQHFSALIESDEVKQAKTSLTAQLERVLLAREVALAGVAEAIETARDARKIQTEAELILAYQGTIQPAASELHAWDYTGEPIVIKLKPDLTPVENANRYFAKAKRAILRVEEVEAQRTRLESDREALVRAIEGLSSAQTTSQIRDLRDSADRNRWLQRSGEAKAKVDRPFEGHAVRELLSPGGWRVLYGDNATANDYLTTKIAKPSDIWFHVRGAPSAHVVLCTNNQPLKVQRADLEFAAKVAVSHSPSKHSGFVSVDYTQKRYVRKPRGSNPGTAVYTQEKTLHVSDS